MARSSPGMWKPALIGGAVFGFLGGAPVVSALNCACCALILGAGFLAAYLQSRDAKSLGVPFTPSNGALVGFVAGIVYGVADTLTSTLSTLLFQKAAMEWIVKALQEVDEIPPGVLDLISGQSRLGLAAVIALGLIVSVGFGMIFATLGGLIGGAVFKASPAAPAAPAQG